MRRAVPPLLAALLVAPLLAPAASAGYAPTFETSGGNEWWVEVRVESERGVASVEARADDGPWHALAKRSWGTWAESFHVPDGSLVQFRATASDGETALSGRYVWPSGEPATGGGGGSFSASFENVRGNEWWIETDVRASGALAGVDARVDGGAWQALALRSWGSWARSIHAPEGSIVELRARGEAGGEAVSGGYRWTSATPVDGGMGGGDDGGAGAFDATFRGPSGNEWWIQVGVDATEALAGVDARVDGGAWRALDLKSWGDWAKSIHAPEGSVVEFRARAASGATDVSGAYRWTSATPVDSGGDGGDGLRVAVDASVGPWGGARVDVDRPFYGLNIADWEPETYRPDPEADFLAYLRALEPGVLRWPAGHTSQSTVWERTPGESWGNLWLSTGHFDDFVSLARDVGAQPLIAVNTKTASPQQAADMVRYANLEKGYGITWWQLGNEPDHLDGLTSGPEEYARQVEDFARAMRAVDPSIRLVGGEIMTGAHVVGSNGAPDWLTPIVERAGHHLDAISWHYYPLDSGQESASSSAYPTVENLFQETATDWRPSAMAFADEIFPHLKELRDAHSPGAQLWVTEMAEDSGDGGKEGIVGAVAGMLWTADILGRFAAHGPDAITKFVFQSGSSHRFTLLDENHDPRPAYYAYWLYARHMGDDFARATSDDRTKVAAHAAIRDDGALTVILANKDTQAHAVSLDVSGFSASSAQRYVVAGSWYGDETVTMNGETLRPWNVDGSGELQGEWVSVADATRLTLQPYTVTLVVLHP